MPLLTVMEHVGAEPEQFPFQPAKVEPLAAVAVNVSTSPAGMV